MEKPLKSIWISKNVLDWNPSLECRTFLSQEPISRAYNIWEHSKSLIEGASSDFALADGITNVKRSLNHRLKLIEDIYSFKDVSIKNKPKHYLELLERYQIVRPYLMKSLLSIRNDIEHNDAPPPDINRCKELLDVVWYFLKSTDKIVQSVQEVAFELEEVDSEYLDYWFTPQIYYGHPFSVLLRGRFPQDLVSYDEKDGFFMINQETMPFKEHKYFPYHDSFHYYMDKSGSDFSIYGSVKIETIEIEKLISKVISAY